MAHGKTARNPTVGRWSLVRKLGGGGNADVWAVRRDKESLVAMKLLTRRGREAYERFKSEVQLLHDMKPRVGLLPILEYMLPNEPDANNRAWFTMPIAKPLRRALGAAPSLESIVSAVSTIAATLADLHSQGISHRD